MDDLHLRAAKAIEKAIDALSGKLPLQEAMDAILKLRRECARRGENALAYKLWEVERRLWERQNPRSGDSSIA